MAPVAKPEDTFPISLEEFEEIREEHSFRFERERMDIEKSRALLKAPVWSLMELPEEQRTVIKLQSRAIRKFLGMERDGAASRYGPSLREALETIQRQLDDEQKNPTKRQRGGMVNSPSFKLVGPKQFLIWVEKFVTSGPLGLIRCYHECGRRGPRYNAEEYAKLFEYVGRHLTREAPSVAMLHRDMKADIHNLNLERQKHGQPLLNVPSKALLGGEIAHIPAFDKMAAHKGVPYASNFFRAARGGVPDVVRPMQRVEADEWLTHLHTLTIEMGLWDMLGPEMQEKATKTRVWLAAAICGGTRCIPALVIAPGTGSQNTRMMIRMALTDKTALGLAVGAETPWDYRGNIDLFALDGGTSNVNDDVDLICSDLGIALKVAQGEKPTQRGKIERFFQTLDIRSIARFSGRTSQTPLKRGNTNLRPGHASPSTNSARYWSASLSTNTTTRNIQVSVAKRLGRPGCVRRKRARLRFLPTATRYARRSAKT